MIETPETLNAAQPENARPMFSGCARPILFSGPMISAILAGKKTQTRRIAKMNVSGRVARAGRNWHPDDPNAVIACPFGQSGDRLWVRETWFDATPFLDAPVFSDLMGKFAYKADGTFIGCHKWRPSIHMPRVASRITLAIDDVRLEHLQSVTYIDAKAEGVTYEKGYVDPRDSFRRLWESIAGPGSWDINPWVWVISFRVV